MCGPTVKQKKRQVEVGLASGIEGEGSGVAQEAKALTSFTEDLVETCVEIGEVITSPAL